jgi:hypothetical protein
MGAAAGIREQDGTTAVSLALTHQETTPFLATHSAYRIAMAKAAVMMDVAAHVVHVRQVKSAPMANVIARQIAQISSVARMGAAARVAAVKTDKTVTQLVNVLAHALRIVKIKRAAQTDAVARVAVAITVKRVTQQANVKRLMDVATSHLRGSVLVRY